MQNKKIVIFDFDGTIADSEAILFDVMNDLSCKFGFRKIKKDEISDLKKKTISKLIKEFKVSYIKLPFIVTRARKMFRERIKEVSPVKGMPKAMEGLKDKGYKIIIVTTNNKETAQDFLRNNKISFVDDIVGGGSIFGKAKTLEKVVKKERVAKKEVFYIGDEIRDIEAAKQAGLRTISVAWGFNSADVLSKYEPDYLINKPDELLGILS